MRADAVHESDCPEIGPICAIRAEPPQLHHTALWVTEVRLLAEYGLLDWLAVQAMFPLRLVDTRTRYTNLSGEPLVLDYPDIHHRNETLLGPGDPQVLAHLGTVVGRFSLGARLGVSLPLGAIRENPYRLGAMGLPHEHLQFGTGTVDPVLGVEAAAPLGRLTLSAFAFTQVPLYAARNGFQAGARLFGGATLAAPLGDTGASLRATAVAFNEWPERWDGVVPTEDGNRGRSDLYVGLGVSVPFLEDWSMSLDLRGRAWGQVVGAQLDMPLVVELSIGRLLHFEGSEESEAAPSSTEATPVKWTVVDSWAPWCKACGVLERSLRELSAVHPEIAVQRVEVGDDDMTPLPHVRLLDSAGRVVLEESGTAESLMKRIRERVR